MVGIRTVHSYHSLWMLPCVRLSTPLQRTHKLSWPARVSNTSLSKLNTTKFSPILRSPSHVHDGGVAEITLGYKKPCMKTTIMIMINKVETPDDGDFYIGEKLEETTKYK